MPVRHASPQTHRAQLVQRLANHGHVKALEANVNADFGVNVLRVAARKGSRGRHFVLLPRKAKVRVWVHATGRGRRAGGRGPGRAR